MTEEKIEILRKNLYKAFCDGEKNHFAKTLEKVIEEQPEYYEKVKTNMLNSAAWLRSEHIFKYLVGLQKISEKEAMGIWERFK